MGLRSEQPGIIFKIFKHQYGMSFQTELNTKPKHWSRAWETPLLCQTSIHYCQTMGKPGGYQEDQGALGNRQSLRGIWAVIMYWSELPVIIYGAPGSTYLPTGIEVFQYFKTDMAIQCTLAEDRSGIYLHLNMQHK